MINKYVAIGLGALIALAPVAAIAQEQVAQATPDTTMAAPMAKPAHTGSYRRHIRRKGHTANDRARASAEHVRKLRTAPAEAPKS